VFDVGNVLLRWNPRNLYRRVFEDPQQIEWFLANVCDGAWNEAQDLGRKWGDAVAERIARFPEWEAAIRAYDERWMETLDGEIGENVQVLGELKARGIPLFAITNFSQEKFVLARARHRFFDLFDGIVVSGEEGLMKPDPRIFRLFLDRYGVTAQDCIFIDDNEANIAVASHRFGMSVIHYAEGLDLAEALKKLNVPLPEAEQSQIL
jgi:2-haloacid dehalogenase